MGRSSSSRALSRPVNKENPLGVDSNKGNKNKWEPVRRTCWCIIWRQLVTARILVVHSAHLCINRLAPSVGPLLRQVSCSHITGKQPRVQKPVTLKQSILLIRYFDLFKLAIRYYQYFLKIQKISQYFLCISFKICYFLNIEKILRKSFNLVNTILPIITLSPHDRTYLIF